MEYTEFGKTQLRVSRMCLGTWGIGGAGWDSYSDESRMDAIKAAVDCGINFIDTAPAYNGGRAEQYIGEVVHKLGVRKEVILATGSSTRIAFFLRRNISRIVLYFHS